MTARAQRSETQPMAGGISYFAYGAAGEGYQWIVSTGPRRPDLHPAVDFALTGEPGGRPGAPQVLPVRLDLRAAVVLYIHKQHTLWLDRPQASQRRGTLFTEALVLDGPALEAVQGRPLRLLGLFALQPSPQEALRAERDLQAAKRTAQDRPLYHLLSPGFSCVATLRRMLARVLAHCTRTPPEAHLAVVLPERHGHLAPALATALDELLPPPRRQRGFAFATVLVNGPTHDRDPRPALYESLDWTVLPEEEHKRTFAPLRPEQLCDLRPDPAGPDPVAEAFEKLLARGAELVQAFFAGLTRRLRDSGLRGDLCEVPAENWARLGVELTGPEGLARVPPAALVGGMDWRNLSRRGFLRLWEHLGRYPSARTELLEKLLGWTRQCPPILAWLLQPEVSAANPRRIAQALAEAMTAPSPRGTK